MRRRPDAKHDDARAQVERALDAAKTQGVAEPLFRSARLLNELALAQIYAATGLALRPAHTALFPHIDLDGVRLTELANRLGVSKQAIAPLVDELVAMGALERFADPRDGRAKLLRFARAPAGASAERTVGLVHGLGVLASLEADLRDDIGADDWAALQRALQRLLPALERRIRAGSAI